MRQLSVFLVEDEILIRMMVAEMVEELGHRVVAEAGSIKDARPLAQTADFDIAILDVNVGGYSIWPIAEIIEDRRLPLVFASGYGSTGLPPPFRDRALLQKPFPIEKLNQTISTLLGED